MNHDAHFYIGEIGQIGVILCLLLGIPFCVSMFIKESRERALSE